MPWFARCRCKHTIAYPRYTISAKSTITVKRQEASPTSSQAAPLARLRAIEILRAFVVDRIAVAVFLVALIIDEQLKIVLGNLRIAIALSEAADKRI